MFGITFSQRRRQRYRRRHIEASSRRTKTLPPGRRPHRRAHHAQIHAVDSVFAKDGQAIGVGAGQQSRIHCTDLQPAARPGTCASATGYRLPFKPDIARAVPTTPSTCIVRWSEDVLGEGLWQELFMRRPEPMTAEEKRAYLNSIPDVSLASDAFFPFEDNIRRAAKSGTAFVAQPGGSIRDPEVIEACDALGAVMCFTGLRLFHH